MLCALLVGSMPVYAAEADFETWLDAFRGEASADGISEATLTALDGMVPDERVLRLDQSQPEHKKTFAEYRQTILAESRIRRGQILLREYRDLLQEAESRYGVPAAVIVALWGIESNYGALTGKFSVLRSLATLAYDGRRAELFRRELLAALRIVERGDVTAENLLGSWAGAMGQCQFMPSTYLKFAVDEDGDGKRDIWGDQADIFASIAHYLQGEGWVPDLGWGRPVQLSEPVDPALVGLKQGKLLATWRRIGVMEADGSDLVIRGKELYYLVQPDGAEGDSFLVTENYKAIMRWNRSTYFATAVGLLTDAIAE